MKLEIPREINGVPTDQPVDATGWLTIAKAVFGPVGGEGTSEYARTKLCLPAGSSPELAVGSSSTSKKGNLRFGDSTDGHKYGIWIPQNGVEPQPLFTQPEKWYEEEYGGLLFRTMAGVLRTGAQYMGVMEGRQKETAAAVVGLTQFMLGSTADTGIYTLDEEDLKIAQADMFEELQRRIADVLGSDPSTVQSLRYTDYVSCVQDRISEVVFFPGVNWDETDELE